MKAPSVITIDSETDAIQNRPHYPPKPVGFSIRWPKDRKSKYWAFGHPTENNCDKATARKVLLEAWESGLPLLFQNAKFDVEVLIEFFDLPMLSWERIHDTLYLIFLTDPHAQSYALKPAAERFLGLPPTEQQSVREWLVEHGVVRKNDTKWGACISQAPGGIVGRYADGDVDRTFRLFKLLYPRIVESGMVAAYNRERELMPILLENEKQGIKVNIKQMEEDYEIYNSAVSVADIWLRRKLNAKDLNIDSNADLVEALDKAGIVTDWIMTKKGARSTAKKNLTPEMFNDQKVANVLGYRNRLSTCLSTFILPWLTIGRETSGIIHTNWNQVRQSKGANDSASGTRTGRLSSNPNFQNIPKNFEGKGDGYLHPKFIKSLPELPLMRRYLLSDRNCTWLHRDYNQQELRILAHFEDGEMKNAYLDNPRLDIHDYVRDAIAGVTGRTLDRSAIKILNFGILYGMGLAKLAVGTGTTVQEARTIKDAHRKGIPGVAALEREIKKLGENGEAIRTWGERVYYTEPPRVIEGREQTFEYKLLNYLIQGSAADCTKQAVINYSKIKKDGRFLVTVHDEINISAPNKAAKSEMKLLREAMEGISFDVPMLSDGKSGPSWGELTKMED